jgi:hypothetical protein
LSQVKITQCVLRRHLRDSHSPADLQHMHFAAREEPALLATDITGVLPGLRDAARRAVPEPERLTFSTCGI